MGALTLYRQELERIFVVTPDGDEIAFWYSQKSGEVRLCIEAPSEYSIYREEIMPRRCTDCGKRHKEGACLRSQEK